MTDKQIPSGENSSEQNNSSDSFVSPAPLDFETLSDKINYLGYKGLNSNIDTKDVKKAVKKLKEKTYWVNGHSELCEQIDKIFGEKLIE